MKIFTIEVKKREKDEKFSFEDLEMFHQECFGGSIEKVSYYEYKEMYGDTFKIQAHEFRPIGETRYGGAYVKRNFWILICQRCKATIEIEIAPKLQTVEIIATAIDGKERRFTDEITVVQKT